MIPTETLHKAIKGREYVAGMLSAICIYEGPRKAAEVARYMRQPIEVALYAVRNARPPL